MPSMYGKMRLSVRSEDMAGEKEERSIVRRGTCHANIGAGGACVGKSFRLMVFESSVRDRNVSLELSTNQLL